MEIITTHIDSDFDGMASLIAGQKLYPDSIPVPSGGYQTPVRSFLEAYSFPIIPFNHLPRKKVTRLILVDTQDPERIGPLKPLLDNPGLSLHLFDHHPPPPGTPLFRHAEFCLIETVGATITLLIEQLQEKNVPITPQEATLFMLGLYEETGFLLYPSTTPRDLKVGAFLLSSGADLNLVGDYLRRELTIPQIELLHAMVQSSQLLYLGRRRVLLIILSWPTYIPDISSMIQLLTKIEQVDAILAAIAMNGKVHLIGRSRREDIDVGRIARFFGGGGHSMAAAASIKKMPLPEVEQTIRRLLDEQSQSWVSIGDMMTTPVRTVAQGTTIQETERLMTQYEVNALPVLDSQDLFQGLTTREAVQKALYHGFQQTPVEQIMRRDLFTASWSTPYEEVRRQMLERNQRVVPILEHETVVGIFSRTDLLRAFQEDLADRQQDRSSSRSHTTGPWPCQKRHIKSLMEERLPKSVQSLFQVAGQVADQLGVNAYIVGGFVRDLLLARPNFDVDIVVEGDGIAFGKALASEIQACVKTHERFGTASLHSPASLGLPPALTLDVATARTEYYEFPTALPTVKQSSIKKDLYRRDFTINTLAIRLNKEPGQLLDFFGGKRDIKDRVIRVLHSLSFVEDPTRAFRAIRFEQRFGFTISKETKAFIQNAIALGLFHQLSGHRIGDEFLHLLAEPNPTDAVGRLQDHGLLQFLHPQLTWTTSTIRQFQTSSEVLTWHKFEFPEEPVHSWELYTIALFEPLGWETLQTAWNRLGIPERHTRMVAGFLQAKPHLMHLLLRPERTPAEIYQALHPYNLEILLALMAHCQLQTVNTRAIRPIQTYLRTLRFIKSTVTGSDLQALSLPRGPTYGHILDSLLQAKLNGQVTTREEELERARTLVARELKEA